jgi:hypothetical protein
LVVGRVGLKAVGRVDALVVILAGAKVVMLVDEMEIAMVE